MASHQSPITSVTAAARPSGRIPKLRNSRRTGRRRGYLWCQARRGGGGCAAGKTRCSAFNRRPQCTTKGAEALRGAPYLWQLRPESESPWSKFHSHFDRHHPVGSTVSAYIIQELTPGHYYALLDNHCLCILHGSSDTERGILGTWQSASVLGRDSGSGCLCLGTTGTCHDQPGLIVAGMGSEQQTKLLSHSKGALKALQLTSLPNMAPHKKTLQQPSHRNCLMSSSHVFSFTLQSRAWSRKLAETHAR